MRQRGRPSAASLSLLVSGSRDGAGPILPGDRPEPPEALSEAEKTEWRAIVTRMPQDWFQREAWPVLAGLCRATVEVNHLSAEMTRLFKGQVPKTAKDWKRYLSMSRTRSNLMALIGNLSGKLRLNHQSRFDRTQAANIIEGRAAKYPRPWEGYDIRRGAG